MARQIETELLLHKEWMRRAAGIVTHHFRGRRRMGTSRDDRETWPNNPAGAALAMGRDRT
jgi:hypothetical protein